jgi:hypothetical protein
MDELKGQKTLPLLIIVVRMLLFFEESQLRDLVLELKTKLPGYFTTG